MQIKAYTATSHGMSSIVCCLRPIRTVHPRDAPTTRPGVNHKPTPCGAKAGCLNVRKRNPDTGSAKVRLAWIIRHGDAW